MSAELIVLKNFNYLRSWLFAGLLVGGSEVYAQSMNFDDLPGGTLFGAAAGDAPTDVVYTRNGIDMAVDSFFLGSFVGFYDAEVEGTYAGAFGSPALGLDNISVVFTFPGLGFSVSGLSFDFVEFGGAMNLSINDGPVLQLETFNDLPVSVAPGIIAEVSSGTMILSAPASQIVSLRIGGQELVIDNLTVVPEPVSAVMLAAGSVMFVLRRYIHRLK